jgi:hypothetical protein
MVDFTAIFQSDVASGIEIEGFWIMFSSNSMFMNLNLPLGEQPTTGWDNRNSMLRTNTVYVNGKFESSFYPNDVYDLDASTVAIDKIRSWYLVYRLAIMEDKVENYRIAVGLSVGQYPLLNFWHIQNALKGTMDYRAKFTPITIEESSYPENILRRKFIVNESDDSIQYDKSLVRSQNSDLMTHGLFDSSRCVLIT